MRIVFPSTPDKYAFPLRAIGACGRYDTISDCEFLDERRIICCDRQMARLYLLEVDYDTKTYTILDSVDAVVNGKPVHTELLCLQKDILYTISYTDKLFSCRIVGNKFTDMKGVIVSSEEAYHGVCDGGADGMVYVTNMLQNTITLYNTRSRRMKKMVCEGGVRMKDAALLDKSHILVLSSDRGPIITTQHTDGHISPVNTPYNSHALIYNRHTGVLCDTHVFKDMQVDGCFFYKNKCWVTCTDEKGQGSLWRATITGNKFSYGIHLPCEGFPHGIAIKDNILAYTSYGECSLVFHRIDDDGNIVDAI